MSDAVEIVVFRFSKNRREEVRATLGEFHGHQLASVRVYVVDELGESLPTKKGISVRVDELPQLREAVDALIAENERRAA